MDIRDRQGPEWENNIRRESGSPAAGDRTESTEGVGVEEGARMPEPAMGSGTYERSVYTKKKKTGKASKKGFWIWAAIVGAVLLLVILAEIFGEDSGLPSGPYIGTLYIEGEIGSYEESGFGSSVSYHHNWTLNQIDAMEEDSDNQGIVLFLDTPGGGVYESDELYLKLLEYKEVTGRPVYAAMGSTAASGGYYIAAAADQIYANRNTLTGSIGVTMGTQFDLSGFLERYGIRTETLASGENKAMGSMTQPLTEEQRAIYHSIIDEAYQQFVGVVADGRDMSAEQVVKLADGRIYTAKQALNAGLVDAIGSLEDAVYDMMDQYDLWDCDVADLYYDQTSIWDRILAKVELPGTRAGGDAEVLLDYVAGESRYPISYLCEAVR